ncbi:MAG: FKBP-type peptidyl-prolyl cis-trans isomerase [Pseudomonadota bacterium]
MNVKRQILYIAMLVLCVVGCGQGDDATGPSAVAPASTGELVIEDKVVGEGDTAQEGSAVAVHYTGWLYDETADDLLGEQFDSSVERNTPFELVLGQGRVIKGWDQGLVGMRVGGKRRLIIPAELGYGKRGAGNRIPPNATLVFDIELLATASIESRDQKIGEGDEVIQGAKVSVDYTGWLFDPDALGNKGKQFDSSIDRGKPFGFVLGRQQVITGWDVGVLGMKTGGKRTLIIPPSMAYGARGFGNTIPPNSTLVFDIELHEVDTKALQ